MKRTTIFRKKEKEKCFDSTGFNVFWSSWCRYFEVGFVASRMPTTVSRAAPALGKEKPGQFTQTHKLFSSDR